MKIDRLIGILSVLLRRNKTTTAELAEMFEVSRRTIMRDIDTLSYAGIPIVSEAGHGGGVYIMENYKVDRALLSEGDMKAILSGLKGLDSVSGENSYRTLAAKLSGEDTSSYDDHIIIDLSGWDKAACSDKIDIIKKAMENNEAIQFRYFSMTGESERKIEPFHLIYQWSGWYVWGWCCIRNDWRMFKLTRMTELHSTGEQRTKKTVPVYTSDKLLHTKGEIKITVRFEKEVKWRIIDQFGADNIEYDDNGDIVKEFTWSDIPSFYHYMLSFGDSAEIISPAEYRNEYRSLLENMIKKYSG